MKIFRAHAPLRLGLAGGGTDVSPFCDEYGGAVLNVTIGRYAYATVKLLDENVLKFKSLDLNIQEELPLCKNYALTEGLILHRAAYQTIVKTYLDGKCPPLEIITHVDSPLGSGLGSSSTIVVAIVQAMKEAFSLPLADYDIAFLALKIEREVAGFIGGKQDQFAATFGGVNFMEFGADNHVLVNPLRINQDIMNELEASLVTAFTGVSRVSAKIIEDQSSDITKNGSKELEAMHQLKDDATSMKNALLLGDIGQMAKILESSWKAKKATSKSISNEKIDHLYDLAINNGALAGKVSGAGGGGFMFFIVDPVKRSDVSQVLHDNGMGISVCHFVNGGATSWRIKNNFL